MKSGPKTKPTATPKLEPSGLRLAPPARYQPGQPQAVRWDEVIARLEALGIADGVDQKLVERYVDALYLRDRAMAEINRVGMTYEIKDSKGWKIKDAANPCVRQHAQICESLLRMESELCLSPAARARAGVRGKAENDDDLSFLSPPDITDEVDIFADEKGEE